MEGNAVEELPLPLVQKNFHVSIETPTGMKILGGPLKTEHSEKNGMKLLSSHRYIL